MMTPAHNTSSFDSSDAERCEDLRRIEEALHLASELLLRSRETAATPEYKTDGDPVTSADLAVDRLLASLLPLGGEGWLSEESKDDASRLEKSRVWVVDPLDGTKEFIAGIQEWCVSIGLVERGQAVAGGVANPGTGEVFLGSIETGFYLLGAKSGLAAQPRPEVPLVLASRNEVTRGEWKRWGNGSFVVKPVGSIAYRLACVAAGFADATWTVEPRHEWDVAAGVALVTAAGGTVRTMRNTAPVFNRPVPRCDGLVAFASGSQERFQDLPADLRGLATTAFISSGGGLGQ